MKLALFVVVLSFMLSVLARHRPDIFKDQLTLKYAFISAQEAYSADMFEHGKVGSDGDDDTGNVLGSFKSLLRTFAKGIATIGSYADLSACMMKSDKKAISEDTLVGTVRKACPDQFEQFAKNVTETLKSQVATMITDKERKAQYLEWVKRQEQIVEYLPFLPPMQPLHFWLMIAIIVFIVVLVIAMLVCCCRQ